MWRFWALLFLLCPTLLPVAFGSESPDSTVLPSPPATETPFQRTVRRFRNFHQDFFRLATGEGNDISLSSETRTERHIIRDDDTRIVSEHLYASAELPIPTSDNFFWRVAPYYDLGVFRFDNIHIADSAYHSEQLHILELGLGAGWFKNRNLLFTGKLRPGLYSNFQGINSDHFQLFGEFMSVYRAWPNIEFVTGIATDQLFSSYDVFPILALRAHAFDERLHIKITPPIELRIGYYLQDNLQLFTDFALQLNEYHVEHAGRDFAIESEEHRLGVGALYWLSSNLNINVETGVLISGQFELKDPEASPDNDRLNEGLYVTLRLGYAL